MHNVSGASVTLQNREWIERFLLLAAAFAASLALLIRLLAKFIYGDWSAIDERVLLLLRSPLDPADPIGPVWFESAVRDITAVGSFIVLSLLVLGVAGYLLLRGSRRGALGIFAIPAFGWLWSTLLKMTFDRPRPNLVPHEVSVADASLPSGHAMVSAVVYLTLAIALGRYERDQRIRVYLIVLAMLLTLLVGLSRLYLGVHWPTDVLSGWAFAALWVVVGWRFFGGMLDDLHKPRQSR